MNTDYRYQLESKRLTGHQPRLLRAPASPEGTSCPASSVRTGREVPSDGQGRGRGKCTTGSVPLCKI